MQNWQMMAADRLTQLQDAVNLQAENFCNSIGVLQMFAKESSFPEFNAAKLNESNDAELTNDQNNSNGDNMCSIMAVTSKSSSSGSSSSCSSTTTALLNGTVGTNVSSSTTSSSGNRSPTAANQQSSNDLLDCKDENPTKQNVTSDVGQNDPKLTDPLQHDNCQLFARMIARTAKDIDTLIESLPATFETESGPSDLHSNSIRQLEEENAECVTKLEEAIKRGESMLEMIRNALDEIALIQLKSQT